MLKQLKHALHVVLLFGAQLFVVDAACAAEKPSWQVDWGATIQAATKEAQILTTPPSAPITHGSSPSFKSPIQRSKSPSFMATDRISPRLFAERPASKYLADVYLGGPTSLYTFYQNQLFDPLAPLLVLPEILENLTRCGGKANISTSTPLTNRIDSEVELI